ncbi:hypothetical protein [Polaromonas sp.]|uniref:hypothetical protein n=1 Tax=Polaromonas sp. TaxID=1869339 RepID=UPI0035615EFB
MKAAVNDQAAGLRRLMAVSPGRRVAVVGCEHAGVAMVTRNLAAALVQAGKDVLLFDEHGNVQTPGVQGAGRVVLIHAALDGDGALTPLAAQSDHILVVLQAQAASIKASYACIKRLHSAHALERMRVLVDGAADAADAQRILANLADTGRRYLSLALEPAGWVRADPHLARSQRLNVTVVDAFSSSLAAMDYRQVATGLLQWPQPRTNNQSDAQRTAAAVDPRWACEPVLH